jgi:hypothetical protein
LNGATPAHGRRSSFAAVCFGASLLQPPLRRGCRTLMRRCPPAHGL